MTDRNYRLILGICLMTALIMETMIAVYALIGLATLEGLTNWRVPVIVNKWFPQTHVAADNSDENLAPAHARRRFDFEAERAFRLVFAGFTALGTIGLPELLWFLPWLIAFFVLGAGVSGVCPSLWFLKIAGFADTPAAPRSASTSP